MPFMVTLFSIELSGVLKDHTMMIGKVDVLRETEEKMATNFIFYLCHDLCVCNF